MEFYIYIASILLLLSAIKSANNKKVYSVISFLLFFLAAFRGMGVGTDTEGYYYQYYLYVNNESYVALNRFYKDIEVVWMLMLRFFRSMSDYRGILVTLEAMVAIPLFYAIYKQSRWPLFSIFLYITLCFFASSMNAMRQSVAMSFLLLAIPFLENRKYRYYWLMMILSVTIHLSAVVAFILVWFVKKANFNFNKKHKYTVLILVSFVIGMFFTVMFKEALTPLANLLFSSSGYNEYISGGETNVQRNLITNLGLNLLPIFLLYKNSDSNSIYFKLYIFGVVMNNLIAGFGDFANRMTSYFSLMQIIAFPNFICSVSNPVKRILYTLVIIIYSVSVYLFVLSGNIGEIIPYTNIFF